MQPEEEEAPAALTGKTAADQAIDRKLAAAALALATAVAEVVAVLSALDSIPTDTNGGADDGIRLRIAV